MKTRIGLTLASAAALGLVLGYLGGSSLEAQDRVVVSPQAGTSTGFRAEQLTVAGSCVVVVSRIDTGAFTAVPCSR